MVLLLRGWSGAHRKRDKRRLGKRWPLAARAALLRCPNPDPNPYRSPDLNAHAPSQRHADPSLAALPCHARSVAAAELPPAAALPPGAAPTSAIMAGTPASAAAYCAAARCLAAAAVSAPADQTASRWASTARVAGTLEIHVPPEQIVTTLGCVPAGAQGLTSWCKTFMYQRVSYHGFLLRHTKAHWDSAKFSTPQH